MKILLDLQSCQAPGSRNRGIGRYSMSLAQAMVKLAPHNEYWLLLNGAFDQSVQELSQLFKTSVSPERIVTFYPPDGCCESAEERAWLTRVAELNRLAVIRKIQPDVVHVTSLFEGSDCVVSLSKNAESYVSVVTIYDFIPIRHPEKYPHEFGLSNNYSRKFRSLSHADLLLCISGYTASEAVDLLPAIPRSRIVNISSAVDDSFSKGNQRDPASEKKLLQALGITKPFVMYTGGIDWRKNIEGLLAAYSLLPKPTRNSHQLVLVCKIDADVRARLSKLCKSLQLDGNDVIFTGFVKDEVLVHLYKNCTLFVFPSLHEGFGLPVLEAITCGATVIGSSTSSIPEVIGNPDALFDPSNSAAIAHLIERVLVDNSFRGSLNQHAAVQAAKFSWAETARVAMDAIKAAHGRHRKNRLTAEAVAVPHKGSCKPWLAMVTPLPPSESGIADYSLELIRALSAHFEITAVCDQQPLGRTSDAGYAVQTTQWFRQNASSFPHIIYQFGNSNFHAHMFELLRDFPGVVVLHDFFLSGVINWMESTGYSPGAFRDALARSHGNKALIYEHNQGRVKAIRKFPCNSFVTHRAKGVIVHSVHSVELADQFGNNSAAKNWEVIPILRSLPKQNSKAEARKLLGIAPNQILVCSFGHLVASKLNDRLICAWGSSALATDPSCRLIFVGQNDPGSYGNALARATTKAALKGQIEITGFTTSERFETYLAAADFAVQLRSNSRGETSKAVVDCLAYGVPVILNANGSMADYPAGTVCRLPDDFEDQTLIHALELLVRSSAERESLAEQGLLRIRTLHDPKVVAYK